MTPLVLGCLAVLLAGPVPSLMSRWPALRRTPVAAMLLWQSVAMAAVLSAIGAGLSLTTAKAWRNNGTILEYAVATIALGLTLLVVGRLLLSGHRVGTNLRALRRRHRAQLDLLARTERGARVVEHDVPVAYCLPGVAGSRVVVSAGALERLRSDEVDAVLAHERAHLKARHDLVLEGFSVLHRAFPHWVSSEAALIEVQLLAEVLADRAAVRRTGRLPLARALVALAEGRAPLAAMGAAGPALADRVRLLGDVEPHRGQSALVVLLALGVLAVPTTFVVVPWLQSLT
ncbi:Zn-dependent protease with chaperone function [Nocardioides daedukensis]|uniref:Zn-dependent protease with chaperone function n=1 Tax=Nocardioides daedukensis TaxID=634462 RepID=A0A7Y9UNM8_9ACTN|nr:M56 family metallopeptidase [Nocardioides daedukensis]NYG57327.1 Zn-dependent protease with chaperone function [Nocardioides daedukensis]